jgi:hypothetical protein
LPSLLSRKFLIIHYIILLTAPVHSYMCIIRYKSGRLSMIRILSRGRVWGTGVALAVASAGVFQLGSWPDRKAQASDAAPAAVQPTPVSVAVVEDGLEH